LTKWKEKKFKLVVAKTFDPCNSCLTAPIMKTFSMVSSEAKAITENIFFMSQELLSKTVKSISSPTKNVV
jgi:hypothetical protein